MMMGIREFRFTNMLMFFHDFSTARSLLHWCFPSRERRWPRHRMAVHTRVVAKRVVCGRSQIATTANCNFLARAHVIRSGVVRAQLDDRLSRAFLTLARRVGCFPPCVSLWIASANFANFALTQVYLCTVN